MLCVHYVQIYIYIYVLDFGINLLIYVFEYDQRLKINSLIASNFHILKMQTNCNIYNIIYNFIRNNLFSN